MAVTADIKSLINSFDNYVNLYETDSWLNTVTVEEIKNCFKLAKVIEDSVANFESKQCVDTFIRTLNTWWKSKNRTLTYDVKFYMKASDHLLEKFLLSSVTVENVDIAIRMYTSLYPRERFQNVLSDVILKSASYTELLNYTVAHRNGLDVYLLQANLLLKNWVQECNCGRTEMVEEIVTSMLLNYTIKKSLPVLLTTLTVESHDDQATKNIILNKLYVKMDDRSILSKHFWLTVFTDVNKSCLSRVCVRYKEFFTKLIDFVVYIMCMMNYEMSTDSKMMWVGDPSVSMCPDLTYNGIVNVIKYLCNYSVDLRKFIVMRINEAKSTNPLLWDQCLREI